MGRSQEHSFWALKEIRNRTPFEWKGLDSDNGQEFINQILYKYCQREKLEFTRSRPNRKNDNACLRQTMLILNRKTGSMTGKSWVI